METLSLIGTALGLGFASGIRLYSTVFLLGLMLKFDWIHLTAHEAGFGVLNNWAVITVAGLALLVEFFADKIMWVDTLSDTVHTIIRPVGAAVLAAKGFVQMDPAFEVILVILVGGTAFVSHSSKAAARFGLNHSPEPFSNIAVSSLEELFVPFLVWLTTEHPVVTLVLVSLFLVAFIWIAPKVFRIVRLQLAALGSWMGGKLPLRRDRADAAMFAGALGKPDVLHAVRLIAAHSIPVPGPHATALQAIHSPRGFPNGMRAAAGRDIHGLQKSIGYLTPTSHELVFVTRRLFTVKVRRYALAELTGADWKKGLLMNRLLLAKPGETLTFYVFKNVDLSVQFDPAPAQWIPPAPAPARKVAPLAAPAPRIAPLAPAKPQKAAIELYCRTGLLEGSRYPIPPEGILIGRSPRAAHLIVESEKVSAQHVRVVPHEKGLWIEDMKSTNGTYVGGTADRISGRRFLTPGSRFSLSNGVVEFEVRQI